MKRLERIVAALPDAERVDVEEWGDHPTFRVGGKSLTGSELTCRAFRRNGPGLERS